MYTDDLPHTAGLLHAALVKSARPHARITSLDASPALQVHFIPCSQFVESLRLQEARGLEMAAFALLLCCTHSVARRPSQYGLRSLATQRYCPVFMSET